MPSVALALSVMFSTWLVVRDYRRRRSLSPAIWIPTLLLLILGSRPLSAWLGAGGNDTGNEGERSLYDQIFFFVVLLACWLIASSRRVRWGKFFAANPVLMVLYGYFAASILWSGDPFGSSKRLVKDFGLLFVVALILSEKDPLQAIRAVYVRCAAILFPLSVVFIKYYPALGRSYSIAGEPMANGVTTQKNTLGEMVLVFGLFLFWDYLETRPPGASQWWRNMPWDRMVLLIMGLWLLHASQSKTSLVCLLLGAILIFSRRVRSKAVASAVLIFALSCPFLTFFANRFSSVVAPVVEALGRNMTFTGRTNIWDHITWATVNPIIGGGYWNFWGGRGGQAIADAMRTVIPNAHCGYVDIYLDGGFVGLALLLFLLVSSGKRLVPRIRLNRFQQVRFAVLIVMIFYNISETTFLRMGPIWFTTLMAIVSFPLLKKTAVASRTPHPAEDLKSSTAEIGYAGWEDARITTNLIG